MRLISCLARREELRVGAVDEVHRRVALDEPREPNRDRAAVWSETELRDDPGEPFSGALERRPGDSAYEFVSADPHDWLIGTKLRAHHIDDVLEHQVSGVMTFGVVGCLEAVDIHVYGDQLSVASIGSVDLTLYIGESRSAAPRSGQLVDFAGLQLRRGLDAVLGRQYPV